MKNHAKLVALVAAAVMSGYAVADTTYTLNPGATLLGNGYTVTGYANTGAGSTTNDFLVETQSSVSLYSGGIGIRNNDACGTTAGCDGGDGTSPEHAVDNNARYEMLLLTFANKVKLTGMTIGWKGTATTTTSTSNGAIINDSDMTVLAYTGSTPLDMSGKTWSTLGSGWTVIGNYADVVVNNLQGINAGGVSSSYWLVGAYNNLAGGGTFTQQNDAVKILSVQGIVSNPPTPPSSVPEPGSLALFGLAFAGLIARRKFARS